jgi:hypothetical protein
METNRTDRVADKTKMKLCVASAAVINSSTQRPGAKGSGTASA